MTLRQQLPLDGHEPGSYLKRSAARAPSVLKLVLPRFGQGFFFITKRTGCQWEKTERFLQFSVDPSNDGCFTISTTWARTRHLLIRAPLNHIRIKIDTPETRTGRVRGKLSLEWPNSDTVLIPCNPSGAPLLTPHDPPIELPSVKA